MVNNKMFFLILLVVGVLFAQADESSSLRDLPQNEFSLSENMGQVELDSVSIYKELIALEDKESSCAMDVVGIVVGGGITGFGATLVGFGMYAIFSNSNSQSLDDGFDRVGGGLLILASVPVFLLGIPVLVNNIGDYKVHKKHAIKRDEYQEALDRYKVRKQEEVNSVQLMVVPTLNLANAGFGANAILLF